MVLISVYVTSFRFVLLYLYCIDLKQRSFAASTIIKFFKREVLIPSKETQFNKRIPFAVLKKESKIISDLMKVGEVINSVKVKIGSDLREVFLFY